MILHYRAHTEARTWYIVFDVPRSRRRRWWHLFTGSIFSHCWAFSDVGGGVVRVEPLAWGLCVMHEALSVDDMLKGFYESTCTAILSVTVDYRTAVFQPLRGFFTCVSIIKALLGVANCPFTITPFQLYKMLCKHEGCIAIKPYIPYVGG